MPVEIIIAFHFDQGSQGDLDRDLVHRVRNFNDALFAAAKHDEGISFSLTELDKLTGQRIGVKSRAKLRRSIKKVEELLASHFSDDPTQYSLSVVP